LSDIFPWIIFLSGPMILDLESELFNMNGREGTGKNRNQAVG